LLLGVGSEIHQREYFHVEITSFREEAARARIIISLGATMPELEQMLISVWRQTLVDGAKHVEIDGGKYPVKTTAKRGLKQVDFQFDGRDLRGLEQNPETKSRWAKMAREGKKVMQFLDAGKYVAVVVDGRMKTYG
jgi:hypothetical protein